MTFGTRHLGGVRIHRKFITLEFRPTLSGRPSQRLWAASASRCFLHINRGQDYFPTIATGIRESSRRPLKDGVSREQATHGNGGITNGWEQQNTHLQHGNQRGRR